MFTAGLTASATLAQAHEIVGNRLFPATLAIDDPGVNDELAFPTIAWSKTGDDPSFKQRDISAEFSKRITEDFAISFAPTWSRLYAPGGPAMNGAHGFQNLETTFKYRLFKNPEHEFVMSAGLEIEWGGSGSQDVGAERFTVYTPTLYFGKGLGDLPASLNWARPFAITGQVGYAIPGVSQTTMASIDPDSGEQNIDTEFHPRVLNWGATIQYSMPYLKSAVVDLGLPDFVNRLIPIVEAAMQTPVSNTATSGTVTTGTINPGIIYAGNTFQVAIEAMIPVNGKAADNMGIIGQLHFFLDDIFPNTLGRPIFANQHQHREADIRPLIMRIIIASVIVLLAARPAAAFAHAHLDHASPVCWQHRARRRRKSCSGSPKNWNRPSARSTCATNRAGRCRPAKQASPAERTQMRVPLKGVAAGNLQGDLWRVLSVDTHRYAGRFQLPRRALSASEPRASIDRRSADPGAWRPFRRNAARGGHDRFHLVGG